MHLYSLVAMASTLLGVEAHALGQAYGRSFIESAEEGGYGEVGRWCMGTMGQCMGALRLHARLDERLPEETAWLLGL